MTDAPSMNELLKDAPSNWGKWGPDDEVGALNYLTPGEVMRGIGSVRTGRVFTLQRMIGDPKGDPVWPGRTPAVRTQILDESNWYDGAGGPEYPGGLHYADDKLDAFLQGSTQYDALGHEDLVACAEAQGTPIEKHDILVVRTNYLKHFFDKGDAFYDDFCEPGLTYSLELAQWFQDMEIPNLATDTIANEVTYDPGSGVALPLHCALMRNLGVALTEICDLEELAADCAEDGQFTFFYVAAPLKVAKAAGTPVNPVVIK